MPFADQYLARHNVSGRIESHPHPGLRFIVVIPCYDEPDLLVTLDSLWSCSKPEGAIEILIVINSPVDAPEAIITRNKQTIAYVKKWADTHYHPYFRTFTTKEQCFPEKYAGPGLARKIGMDEAVLRFNRLDRPDGVILSMDADCTVKPDYFVEIERHLAREPEAQGFSVYFEHPVTGLDFDCAVYDAIAQYELHLRYYIQAIRNTGFPHAYHTVGSCFGVTVQAYVEQGGMNKRKGGEDFYFLQKVIPHGNFHEINTTCVYPSPRPSHRVPFGTGPAVWRYLLHGEEFLTYNPVSFNALMLLFDVPEQLFQATPETVRRYLNALTIHLHSFLREEFEEKIYEINANCASEPAFRKRFYRWFNMFKILKYLNFVHENHFSKQPVSQAAATLLKNMGIPGGKGEHELLKTYRNIQKIKS
jgi:hypothetical protein